MVYTFEARGGGPKPTNEAKMIDFLRSGGTAIFYVLAVGFVAIGYAVLSAISPRPHRIKGASAFAVATVLSAISGTVAGFGATFMYLVGHEDAGVRILYEGLAESLSNAILGFSMAAVAYTVLGVAKLRSADLAQD